MSQVRMLLCWLLKVGSFLQRFTRLPFSHRREIDVAARCKELGVNALHIKIRATGGKGK